MLDEGAGRRGSDRAEFRHYHDSASTEDMDDALYAEELADGRLQLTWWLSPITGAEGSKLDNAKIRARSLPAGLQYSYAATWLSASVLTARQRSASGSPVA